VGRRGESKGATITRDRMRSQSHLLIVIFILLKPLDRLFDHATGLEISPVVSKNVVIDVIAFSESHFGIQIMRNSKVLDRFPLAFLLLIDLP
jgi:hypothetical protein